MGLALHLLALFALACVATSAVAYATLGRSHTALPSGGPRARAHALIAALAAPPVVGAALVAWVALPHQWLGLVDHCDDHPGHAHLCLLHGAPRPHPLVSALGCAALALVVARLVTAARGVLRAARVERSVRAGTTARGAVRVLASDEPIAFTTGVLEPFVVVSAGVAAAPERWRAVIAHEQAHAAARDPLMRAIALALRAFHVPGFGEALVRRLCDEQELAADEASAAAIGSRIEVAETLVAWMGWTRSASRARTGDALVASRFDSGPFERRVHALLEAPAATSAGAAASRLRISLAAGLVLALSAAAPIIHHGIETLFGLLSH